MALLRLNKRKYFEINKNKRETNKPVSLTNTQLSSSIDESEELIEDNRVLFDVIVDVVGFDQNEVKTRYIV